MKIPLILILISLASFNVVLGQHRLLMVSPSKFKLLTTDVSYQGETCSPSAATDTAYLGRVEVIRIGHEAFYQANRFYRNDRGDGLVVENFEARRNYE